MLVIARDTRYLRLAARLMLMLPCAHFDTSYMAV